MGQKKQNQCKELEHKKVTMEKLMDFTPVGEYEKISICHLNGFIAKGGITITMSSDKNYLEYHSHSKNYNLELKMNGDMKKHTVITEDSTGRLYYAKSSDINKKDNHKNKKWKYKKLLKLTHITNNKLVFSGYGSSGATDDYHRRVTITMIKGKGRDGFMFKTITRLDGKKAYSSFFYK